jgi:hypothetical protein
MNSVPGVMTFESKVADSSLGGSFLPSLSNSSRNLDSSIAYHTREHQSKKVNQIYALAKYFIIFPVKLKLNMYHLVILQYYSTTTTTIWQHLVLNRLMLSNSS